MYLTVVLSIAWLTRGRVEEVQDFVLAGRQLGVGVIAASLLATWIGAGTLLVAADEIRRVGLKAIALEPFGAGLSLFVGAIVARRIRRLDVATLPDLFRSLYGPRMEGLSSAVLIPGDLVWIAVQYLALGAIIELYLHVPMTLALPVVAGVGLLKNEIGGLYSATITDALQIVLIVVGMVTIAGTSLLTLGGGSLLEGGLALERLGGERLSPVPPLSEALTWSSLLLASSLGNATDTALIQRISAARSSRAATLACLIAGTGYLLLGLTPVIVGLASGLLIPGVTEGVMPALAKILFDPWWSAVFIVALVAAVLSTIESMMLSPSAILARNIGSRMLGLAETVRLHRISLALIAASTLLLAFCGIRPYRLLTLSYESVLVTVMVPCLFGLWRPSSERVALWTVALGGGTWVLFTVADEGFFWTRIPNALGALGLSVVVYLGLDWLERRSSACQSHSPAPRGPPSSDISQPAERPVSP